MPIHRIPQSQEGLNHSEKKVLEAITQFFGNPARDVFIYLQPRIQNKEPDFIIVDENCGVIIVEVKAWKLPTIQEINDIKVVLAGGDQTDNPAYKTHQYHKLTVEMLKKHPALCGENNQLLVPVHSVLWLTNISIEGAHQKDGLTDRLTRYPTITVYRDTHDRFEELLRSPATLLRKVVNGARAVIFPEIWVQPKSEVASNALTPRIALDAEQESFARSLPHGHFKVDGIPGSGKTIMLVARALHLLQRQPEWNILIVVYTKTLAAKLDRVIKRNAEELKDNDSIINRVEVKTFHSVAFELGNLRKPDNANREERDQYWREDLPLAALPNATPTYDAILVDEYQDFYRLWLEVLVKLLIPSEGEDGQREGSLFLAGDVLQAIHQDEIPAWRDLGIRIHGGGRSKCLTKSYRTARIHTQIGLQFLTDSGFGADIQRHYGGVEGITLGADVKGTIGIVEGDMMAILNHLRQLVAQGASPSDCLVVMPWYEEHIVTFMDRTARIEELREQFTANKEDVGEAKGFVCTYPSAKGLERKYVYLCFIDDFEGQAHLTPRSAAQHLYVGITRAADSLFVHSNRGFSGSNARKLKRILDEDL